MLAILGSVFTMITGGNDTTTGTLGGSLELLARQPEQWQRGMTVPAGARVLLRLYGAANRDDRRHGRDRTPRTSAGRCRSS